MFYKLIHVLYLNLLYGDGDEDNLSVIVRNIQKTVSVNIRLSWKILQVQFPL